MSSCSAPSCAPTAAPVIQIPGAQGLEGAAPQETTGHEPGLGGCYHKHHLVRSCRQPLLMLEEIEAPKIKCHSQSPGRVAPHPGPCPSAPTISHQGFPPAPGKTSWVSREGRRPHASSHRFCPWQTFVVQPPSDTQKLRLGPITLKLHVLPSPTAHCQPLSLPRSVLLCVILFTPR